MLNILLTLDQIMLLHISLLYLDLLSDLPFLPQPLNLSHLLSMLAPRLPHHLLLYTSISLPSLPDNLILTLVNQTALTVNESSPEFMNDCWLCTNARPPFYEGIALIDVFYYSNSSSSCRWTSSDWSGMSLTQVVGLGLCLTTSHRFPPFRFFLLLM